MFVCYDIHQLMIGDSIMMINRTYKFRLYPNLKQKELINKTLGSTRLVYNYYLDKIIEAYEKDKQTLSCYSCFHLLH